VDDLATHTNTNTNIPPQKEGSPLPPDALELPLGDLLRAERDAGFVEGVDAVTSGPPAPAQASPMVWFTLDGWELSEALRSEAALAGVPPGVITARVAELRNGPIGGRRGVIDRDAYVRSQFPKWRKWAEEERHREATPRTRGDALPGPAGARATGWGRHLPIAVQEFCQRHALDPSTEVRDFLATGAADAVTHDEADRLFRKHLQLSARRKGRRGDEAVP
jgi:hypothetical protein